MGLQLEDKWIWDFWHAEESGVHHLFFLQAPKDIGDPSARHWNVSIGHAVSDDLESWELRPDALEPGPPGAWDDLSTWTGSITRDKGRWHMLYTGTSTVEDGRVQRIGVAVSHDLDHWERPVDHPVIETDPSWYETLDAGVWHDQAWRDPWVFRVPGDQRFHALITARARSGAPLERGVLGHAVSENLIDWVVGPPLTRPDGFGQLEVPQLVALHDRWFLLFCSDTETQSEARRRTVPGTGTYYLSAESPLGPWETSQARPLSADLHGSSYAGRIVPHRGETYLLSWLRNTHDGRFVGEIGDPVPVRGGPDGEMTLVSPL
ncbi:MAG: glycosyl hydrolase family 32 [Acidimicrobiia bacterium]